MRRITFHIYFGLSDETQRQRLWEHYLVELLPHDADAKELAGKFPGVSGSDIANAVLSAAIRAGGTFGRR